MVTTEFLVINKIPTLRRLTVSALKNLGYGAVQEASTPADAKRLLVNTSSPLIIILELTPTWSRTQELEFLDYLKDEFNQKIPVIITSEIEDTGLFKQLSRWGISDFVLQTFMLEKFGDSLHRAIQKQMPGLNQSCPTKK